MTILSLFFFGTGEGSFGEEVLWSLASSPRDLAVGDFDGDGNPDMAAILVGDDGNFVAVFTSQGDGSFDLLFESPAGISPDALTVADVNCDGRLDLMVGNFRSIDVYLSKEDGTFELVSTPTPIRRDSLAVADFDGDGLVDVAACERGSPYLIVGLGRGDGGFDLLSTETLDRPIECVLTGDFNEDMSMDLVLVVGDGTILSLTGRGDGSFERTSHLDRRRPGAALRAASAMSTTMDTSTW
ncbi:VCBS repeat-containing protein [Thermogutta sp.]|uniref:FG-GAP repeat domain-containing protein n=1 Tax=Thermogutta sp. TaxID=1962930 RepID=UPI00321F7FCF